MKRFSQICPKLFKSPLALIFLTANLFICLIVSDWEKVFAFIESLDKYNCEPVIEKISFGFSCHNALYSNPFEIPKGLFYFVCSPSFITTAIFTLDLKTHYPHWCPETFDFIEEISFIFFNSLYLMTMGYLIETAHLNYSGNNSPRKNPLSIYSNVN